jgi:hypothetical protein
MIKFTNIIKYEFFLFWIHMLKLNSFGEEVWINLFICLDFISGFHLCQLQNLNTPNNNKSNKCLNQKN